MRGATQILALQSASFVLRERIVAVLVGLFVALVLLSSWLGWSATATVTGIYIRSAAFLQASGQPVPPNPVLDISPLSLMRNMVVYVALIGALAAIVIGNQLVALDRKSGVIPLIGVRPVPPHGYALAKIAALGGLVIGLTALSALVSVATFAILPQTTLDGAGWARLAGFFGLSAIYMMILGLVALASAAFARAEGVGLLVPVTLWLTLTFILPALTSNILPTAALNPISALAPLPESPFFQWAGWALGPVSLADAYKIDSARLLGFLPQDYAVRAMVPPLASLLAALVLAAVWATHALTRIDLTKGDYDA
ncbi:MAG: ABC transporter permease [Rhodobacter sp.]|nr:ABC transporter permease [Rhodobacter sp.]